jgi:hypothetical protein
LPVPGGPSGTTLSLAVRKVELAEVQHQRLLHRALKAEVELLEGLAGREARLLDPGLAAVCVA